jgi:hypothetical protein
MEVKTSSETFVPIYSSKKRHRHHRQDLRFHINKQWNVISILNFLIYEESLVFFFFACEPTSNVNITPPVKNFTCSSES